METASGIKAKLSHRPRNNNTREETIKGEEMEIRTKEKEKYTQTTDDHNNKVKERDDKNRAQRTDKSKGKMTQEGENRIEMKDTTRTH